MLISIKNSLVFNSQSVNNKNSYLMGMGSTLNSQNLSNPQLSMKSHIQYPNDQYTNDSFQKSMKSIFDSLKTDNFSKNDRSLLKDLR